MINKIVFLLGFLVCHSLELARSVTLSRDLDELSNNSSRIFTKQCVPSTNEQSCMDRKNKCYWDSSPCKPFPRCLADCRDIPADKIPKGCNRCKYQFHKHPCRDHMCDSNGNFCPDYLETCCENNQIRPITKNLYCPRKAKSRN